MRPSSAVKRSVRAAEKPPVTPFGQHGLDLVLASMIAGARRTVRRLKAALDTDARPVGG